MNPSDLHDLKVHVERIVRPLKLQEWRKLHMRRELLAHLKAALEEERAAGTSEADALEAAKRRLGAPADLTRELQSSARWLDRAQFYLPHTVADGRMYKDANGRLTLGMMTLRGCAQAPAMFLYCLLLAGGLWVQIMFSAYVSSFLVANGRPEHLWHRWVGAILLVGAMLSCTLLSLQILDGAVRRAWREVIRDGLLLGACYVGVDAGICLVLRYSWVLLPCGIPVAAATVAALIYMARFLRPGIDGLREWLSLEIA